VISSEQIHTVVLENIKLPDLPEEGIFPFVLILFENGQERGRVYLREVSPGLLETHSHIDSDQHRRRGIGTEMYTRLINHAKSRGNSICSSTIETMQPDAKNLWEGKTLNSRFEIEKRQGRYWII
jgi:GNAT superfamily N-acetyltransferase